MSDIDETLESMEIDTNRGTQKSSHTTNPTTCSDVRRSGRACGICGSFNLVEQGVRFCISCGIEEEDLLQFDGWWFREKRKPVCECPDIKHEISPDHFYKVSPRDDYYISKCLDCGAIDSIRFCPNCSSDNKSLRGNGTWKHWDGRIKCSKCGFTIDNSTSCAIGAKNN